MKYIVISNNEVDSVHGHKKYAEITAEHLRLTGNRVEIKRKKLTAAELERYRQVGKYSQLNS